MSEIVRYIKHRRDTAANWTANNPILKLGQLGIETDGLLTNPKFKIGNGVDVWNTLPYANGGGITYSSPATGFVPSTNTGVVATDTLLEALQKLQAQIIALIAY